MNPNYIEPMDPQMLSHRRWAYLCALMNASTVTGVLHGMLRAT